MCLHHFVASLLLSLTSPMDSTNSCWEESDWCQRYGTKLLIVGCWLVLTQLLYYGHAMNNRNDTASPHHCWNVCWMSSSIKKLTSKTNIDRLMLNCINGVLRKREGSYCRLLWKMIWSQLDNMVRDKVILWMYDLLYWLTSKTHRLTKKII